MPTFLSPYGQHRVMEPLGALPQAAWKVDNLTPVLSNEILIDVDMLNIDSASFTQIKAVTEGQLDRMEKHILDIVEQRGKLHNPVTGSGGMLMGTVAHIGADIAAKTPLQVGDRIATLVSLSLTPLRIERIQKIHLERDQVQVQASAILFETSLYAKLPSDMPEAVALAVLDVAGAPAQTARWVKPGDTVVVVGGGGKSGSLCTFEAKKQAGPGGTVIGVSPFEADCQRMRSWDWVDHALQLDARDALAMMAGVAEVTQGRMADVVINCVNIPGTEMGCILATRDRGTIYLFSMATSFSAAALGAEGLAKDVTMIVGNGYAKGHADHALNLLRESKTLQTLFASHYA